MTLTDTNRERAREPQFGSVISVMISRQFQRVDGRMAPHHRFYTECRFCQGTDLERPVAERTSFHLVQHDDGCLLERYLPLIRDFPTALAEARQGAIEECERIAFSYDGNENSASRRIAERIHALAAPDQVGMPQMAERQTPEYIIGDLLASTLLAEHERGRRFLCCWERDALQHLADFWLHNPNRKGPLNLFTADCVRAFAEGRPILPGWRIDP